MVQIRENFLSQKFPVLQYIVYDINGIHDIRFDGDHIDLYVIWNFLDEH